MEMLSDLKKKLKTNGSNCTILLIWVSYLEYWIRQDSMKNLKVQFRNNSLCVKNKFKADRSIIGRDYLQFPMWWLSTILLFQVPFKNCIPRTAFCCSKNCSNSSFCLCLLVPFCLGFAFDKLFSMSFHLSLKRDEKGWDFNSFVVFWILTTRPKRNRRRRWNLKIQKTTQLLNKIMWFMNVMLKTLPWVVFWTLRSRYVGIPLGTRFLSYAYLFLSMLNVAFIGWIPFIGIDKTFSHGSFILRNLRMIQLIMPRYPGGVHMRRCPVCREMLVHTNAYPKVQKLISNVPRRLVRVRYQLKWFFIRYDLSNSDSTFIPWVQKT